MLDKAKLVFKEVSAPPTRWCSSGHHVPAPDEPNGSWRREGAGSVLEPIRFFEASGEGLDGVYCEPCLCIANALAREKKNV
jgi:hypothetical protein